MEKKKKLTVRMLKYIIPFLLIVLIIGETICYFYCKSIVNKEIDEKMNYKMENVNKDLEYNISSVIKIADSISSFISKSYENTPVEKFEKIISQEIVKSDLVSGSGVWFEPYVYNPEEKYVGPYTYKDGSSIKTTNEYSNENYNYFEYDWYKDALGSKKGNHIFSDMYYDETLETCMTTCSIPIYSEDKVIGVVTVDVNLDSINQYINSMKIGEKGKVYLVNEEGLYICNNNSEKLLTTSIKDKSEGYGDIAKDILNSNKSGNGNNNGNNFYYQKFESMNWITVVKVPSSEINKDISKLGIFFVVFSIIIIVVLSVIISFLVKKVVREIIRIKDFSSKLSEGDFSINKIKKKGNDEIGQMCASLNEVLVNNKSVIKNIADHSNNISESSDVLINTAQELKENYLTIEESIKNINVEMMNSSAATEEVNASAEEVNSATTLLSKETSKSLELSVEIKEKANEIQKDSKKAYDNALELSKKYEENLTESIENAKIIDAINEMAQTISNIAEQVSLLSLNASIEAARAGENGKGFAVVAEEIGKLANETEHAVNSIKNTIGEVQNVIKGLTIDSGEIIDFIKGTVTPDYNRFINVAKEYENDTSEFEEIFSKISVMSSDIENVMQEVSNAIVNISESSQATAENSDLIIEKVNNLSESVKHVEIKVNNEKEIVKELNDIVNKFKL